MFGAEFVGAELDGVDRDASIVRFAALEFRSVTEDVDSIDTARLAAILVAKPFDFGRFGVGLGESLVFEAGFGAFSIVERHDAHGTLMTAQVGQGLQRAFNQHAQGVGFAGSHVAENRHALRFGERDAKSLLAVSEPSEQPDAGAVQVGVANYQFNSMGTGDPDATILV